MVNILILIVGSHYYSRVLRCYVLPAPNLPDALVSLLRCFSPRTPSPSMKGLQPALTPSSGPSPSPCPSPCPFFQQLFHAVAYLERECPPSICVSPAPVEQPSPDFVSADLDDLSVPDNAVEQASVSDSDSEGSIGNKREIESDFRETVYIHKQEKDEEFGTVSILITCKYRKVTI